MRTDLRCTQCSTRLSVKSELSGRQVRCPRCRQPVRVPLKPILLPQWAGEAVAPEEQPVMAVVLEESTVEQIESVSEITPEKQSAPAPSPTPGKKRKKKKVRRQESSAYPAWIWLVMVLGALLTTGGLIAGIYLALRASTPPGEEIAWKEHLLVFAISVPITLVILILSMFISSALGGGINFGDLKTVIIGSLFLIIIVNLVNLIPVVGRYFTVLVWLVGLMAVFGLDLWEARFMLFINWVLNFFLSFALMHYLDHQYDLGDDDEDKPARSRPRDDKQKREQKQHRNMEDDDEPEEMGYLQPHRWHEQVARWVERNCGKQGKIDQRV